MRFTNHLGLGGKKFKKIIRKRNCLRGKDLKELTLQHNQNELTMEEISTKNTKAEILKAYEQLLKKLENEKKEQPKQMQQEKQQNDVLSKMKNASTKNIVASIHGLKGTLNNSLEELEISLTNEYKKLEEIQLAISIEKQNLEDLYSLSATTDSLAAMLLTQEKAKEDFEQEMKTKKEALELEISQLKEQIATTKANHSSEEKEYNEHLTKTRKREEEEYQYTLKTTRQKEADVYAEKRIKLEKELAEKTQAFEQEIAQRESTLKAAENELQELRKTSEKFPAELEKALKEKEKTITEQLTNRFVFEKELLSKQTEGELNLKNQTIESLREKITEMQLQIKELTEKANKAENNVKDIAVKAIESSSKIQLFPSKEKENDRN